MDIFFITVGFLVGFIIGLTGVGGGSLMTPILVLGFSVQPVVAVGTDLLYAAVTKCCGMFVHQQKGNIDWAIVLRLAVGSVPAALVAMLALHLLEQNGVTYDSLILHTLGVALILTALVLCIGKQLAALDQTGTVHRVRCFCHRHCVAMTVLSGALIGALVTLSSVGAGAIGAAVLFFLYPERRTITIIGTDLAHAVPLTAIAGMGYMHLGNVDFILLLSLLIGSLPGVYLGSLLGATLSDRIVRPLLAIMLFMIGVKLLFF